MSSHAVFVAQPQTVTALSPCKVHPRMFGYRKRSEASPQLHNLQYYHNGLVEKTWSFQFYRFGKQNKTVMKSETGSLRFDFSTPPPLLTQICRETVGGVSNGVRGGGRT